MSPFMGLPQEIKLMILEYCDRPEYVNLNQTCQELSCLTSELIWNHLDLRVGKVHDDGISIDVVIKKLLREPELAKGVKTLKLGYHPAGILEYRDSAHPPYALKLLSNAESQAADNLITQAGAEAILPLTEWRHHLSTGDYDIYAALLLLTTCNLQSAEVFEFPTTRLALAWTADVFGRLYKQSSPSPRDRTPFGQLRQLTYRYMKSSDTIPPFSDDFLYFLDSEGFRRLDFHLPRPFAFPLVAADALVTASNITSLTLRRFRYDFKNFRTILNVTKSVQSLTLDLEYRECTDNFAAAGNQAGGINKSWGKIDLNRLCETLQPVKQSLKSLAIAAEVQSHARGGTLDEYYTGNLHLTDFTKLEILEAPLCFLLDQFLGDNQKPGFVPNLLDLPPSLQHLTIRPDVLTDLGYLSTNAAKFRYYNTLAVPLIKGIGNGTDQWTPHLQSFCIWQPCSTLDWMFPDISFARYCAEKGITARLMYPKLMDELKPGHVDEVVEVTVYDAKLKSFEKRDRVWEGETRMGVPTGLAMGRNVEDYKKARHRRQCPGSIPGSDCVYTTW